MTRAADLRAIYRDEGVLVTLGSAQAYGIVDIADEVLFDGARVMGAVTELRIITGSLDVAQDDTITMDDVQYQVVQPPRRVGDGKETVLVLGEA